MKTETKLIFKIVGYEFDTIEETEKKQNELTERLKKFHENSLVFYVEQAELIEITAITS